MIRQFTICLLVAGLLATRPHAGLAQEYDTEPISITSVRTLRTSETAVEFEVQYALPTPCWTASYRIERAGRTPIYSPIISVQVRAHEREEVVCAQVVQPVTDTLEVPAPEDSFTGEYLVSFWREEGENIKKSVSLEPVSGTGVRANYPDPFNAETRIPYEVAKPGHVEIAVYAAGGRRVRTLVDRFHEGGRYSIRFDGAGLPSGRYFLQLTSSAGPRVTEPMTLVK